MIVTYKYLSIHYLPKKIKLPTLWLVAVMLNFLLVTKMTCCDDTRYTLMAGTLNLISGWTQTCQIFILLAGVEGPVINWNLH